jgi:iron complex outermembrane recepter protein
MSKLLAYLKLNVTFTCLIVSLLMLICACPCSLYGQVTIKGRVLDNATSEPLIGGTVLVMNTSLGASVNFDGEFVVQVPRLPVDLMAKVIGYDSLMVTVTSSKELIIMRMNASSMETGTVQIVGDRISEKQKQNPLTVETMDGIAIKEASSGNFYESLGNMKGVDMTSASLGFRVINTRGFNSTSPVRTLQLIDGVDNQSPGLNFSLGNFLGACDLDVKKVEIVQGASSAFFGPGAFNGVINMETKDPWNFAGFSAQLRVGQQQLIEPTVRWAENIKNKDGKPYFGYKLCLYYLNAQDWRADNYEPIDGSPNDSSNPGRYDAVNIYGDEYFPAMDYSKSTPWTYRGIGTYYRTGYKEEDLLDYNTENVKGNLSFHFRLKPELEMESPELILANNIGYGTTVYQGDNRFRLRDILFMQNRLELRKKDSFFLRIYSTREDAGRSYDPYATALKIQSRARSDEDWAKVYTRYWQDVIDPRIDNLNYPGLVQNPDFNGTNNFWLPYDYTAQSAWLEQYQDSLVYWHNLVEGWTNADNAGLFVAGEDSTGFFAPGSAQFQKAFEEISGKKNNEGEGGTRFYDRSALYHAHAEKEWHWIHLNEMRVGANARLYTPNSDGTILLDTGDVQIRNFEFGVYAGAEKKWLEDKLIVSATMRLDKNQNFDAVYSPALSVVFSPKKNHWARVSFSSALRNPTLSDQYLNLNVGPATLRGNLDGVDSLVTLNSWNTFRSSLDRSDLDYFNVAPIRPEQVRTLEAGYRASLGKNCFVDLGYYYSLYQYFIGYVIGLDIEFDNTPGGLPKGVDAYRYSANSNNTVQTQGLSVGVNYYLGQYYTLNGNYSWNQLVKTNEEDPIIPAFNTPTHKYNLGITARGIKPQKSSPNEIGFGVNYKWIQGFVFEGSPQFTGFVPTYDLVDAQVNYSFKPQHITAKIGCSNVLNNKVIQTYGGPRIGRLAYISFLYEI